jgi:acetylornithine deacetylase/succinyl-diaminopimelate desuccinylase-like protein
MHDYLNEHRAALIDELADWVRLPSIAGVAEHEPDLARSANWLAARLGEIGFPTVGIWPATSGPAVYAEWCEAPGAPTVLIYSHHDVRAAKDEQWDQTSPFEPALRRGRLYGRGASDAKGQVVAHLWGLRAHLRGRGAPAVNLKVLVEGEEEVGSPGLAALLDEHEVKADLVLYSDTLLWHAEHPALCLSLRGGINAQLRVLGPERDVHSGAVSGAAPNPAVALCQLLARLHDERGRITLPGFYDRVVERPGAYADLPYDDRDWLARSDSRHIVGEHGYTVPQRLWARPAAEVTSLLSGDPVGAARGAIPAVATAGISIRTVGDQRASEVAEQLRRWVAEAMPEGVEYELTVAEEVLQEPYRTPDDLPAAALLAEAMQEGFGVPKVHRMGNAGGGPADLLAHHVGAPVLFFGTGLPEDCWHDSDESVSIDVLLAGAATLAGFWGRLAEK